MLDITDADMLAILAVAMGEALAVGSVPVEAIGLALGVDMAVYWQADDAFFALNRDKEILGAILTEVAGRKVAKANAQEKAKTVKTIIRNHLKGEDGRPTVEHWVPKWMAFPPAAYTKRGGVGSVSAHAQLTEAKAASAEAADTAAASETAEKAIPLAA